MCFYTTSRPPAFPYTLEDFCTLPRWFLHSYSLIPFLHSLPKAYPRQDGVVADFVGGPGSAARNAMGPHFSILSDSAWNSESKCWYQRLTEAGSRTHGYLRLHYQLLSQTDREPYVGIYTDFSFPPPQCYDIRAYRDLTITVRLGQPLAESSVHLVVVLFSSNVDNPDYAFPARDLKPQELSTDWTTLKIPLSHFAAPKWVNYPVPLDLKSVYRLAVVVYGEPHSETSGHIDIRDIRFAG